MVSGSARFCRTIGLILLMAGASAAISTPRANGGELSAEERVAAQRAIEEVYWRHRIWPQENPQPKPPLASVMSDGAIRARVDDTLRKSAALSVFWNRDVTAPELQRELNRMARDSRDPALLAELFGALGNDPQLIAETLVRESLVEGLVRAAYESDPTLHADARDRAEKALAAGCRVEQMKRLDGEYDETTMEAGSSSARPVSGAADRRATLPLETSDWDRLVTDLAQRFAIPLAVAGSASDLVTRLPVGVVSSLREESDRFSVVAVLSRTATSLRLAAVTWPKRSFDAWWAEVRLPLATTAIIALSSPAKAISMPAIIASGCTDDTWNPVKGGRQPTGRARHTAIWTGSEMIIWGGINGPAQGGGGRYNPATDTWTAVSSAASPASRYIHTAVWTGTEMIVWGGYTGATGITNTGGRYNPTSDAWNPTSIGANCPSAREYHTAVWTGSEMMIWGGDQYSSPSKLNSGGRYNPASDAWTWISNGTNCPSARTRHTAVWTGSEMVIWGGQDQFSTYLDTGGRYDPSTDAWTATSTGTNVPAGRWDQTAVWASVEMIIWGGRSSLGQVNTGGRYNPSTNSWTTTSTGANVPAPRSEHTAVWTGTVMIIWGEAAAPCSRTVAVTIPRPIRGPSYRPARTYPRRAPATRPSGPGAR